MVDYFGASDAAVQGPAPAVLASPDPTAMPGSAENPIGDYPAPGPGTFLLGWRCECGHAFLVYARHFDSDAPLQCPECQTDLKKKN